MAGSPDKSMRLAPSRISIVRTVMIALAALLSSSFYESTAAHDFIEKRISFAFLFNMRDRLGNAPSLDARLKVFTFDDSTFAAMKTADLTLDQWASLLMAIDARAPRAIYIDQIFGMTPRAKTSKSALLKKLQAIKTPIITAAFTTESTIKLRRKLDLTTDPYRLKDYFESRESLMQSGFPPMSSRLGWTAYGPNLELVKTFHRVGHVLNSGQGYAAGLLQMGPSTVLPHMTLLGSTQPMIERGHLLVDGHVVPMDARGQILVDYSAPKTYYKHARKLLPLLKAIAANKELTQIDPDDIVLILPAMFTGNTDFAETPVGPLPGGFVIASLLNSRLTQAWLTAVPSSDGPAALAVVLGVAAVALASGYWTLLTIVLAVLSVLVGVVALFTWAGLMTSVSAPLFGMALASGGVMIERYRVRERLLLVLKTLKNQNADLQQELDQAGAISRVFIPAKPPQWDELAVGAYHQPLTGASGDWYGFETSPSSRFRHFLMCDISGHGAQAAIIVSTCKTVLSMIVAENPSSLERQDFVEHYARLLNGTLCQHGEGRHTATFLGLTWEPSHQTVSCVLAGHPRPILIAAKNNKAVYMGKAGSLLGLSREPQLTMTTQTFGPGDSLIAFTDGVPFPRALAKVQNIFETYRHLDPDSGAKYMTIEAKERYAVSDVRFEDDVSLVWFSWRQQKALKAAG